MTSFTLAQPYIDGGLTYKGSHILENDKSSTNYQDYESLYRMDTDVDYAEYAAVGDKREACTILDDADLMRAFYESKLLVSTLDELVRVIKVVHVPDGEYSQHKPGIPFQKVVSIAKDKQKESFNNAWGAILNRNSIRNMASNLQRLLINSEEELTSFWNDVLEQCSFERGRELFEKRTFLEILLKHNSGWNQEILDEDRRYSLLEKCFNLALRWTRFPGLWSRIPQKIDEKLSVTFGLFSEKEFWHILATMKGNMKSNKRIMNLRETAIKMIQDSETQWQKSQWGEHLDENLECEEDGEHSNAKQQDNGKPTNAGPKPSRKRQKPDQGIDVACEHNGDFTQPPFGHVGPAPGSECYRRREMQGWPCSGFNQEAWDFPRASMQGMFRSCADTRGPLPFGGEGPESLPVQAGFPRTDQYTASAAGAACVAQFPRRRGRPPHVPPSSLSAQQEESAPQRIREHHWAGAHYNFQDVSLTKDKLLRDAIRKAQEEEPYCLPLSWRDQEGNQEEVDVKVVTLALEGLLLRKDLPEVNREIHGIAHHLAVGFQENTERIAAEMARDYVVDELERCDREVKLIRQLAKNEIDQVKKEVKQKIEEGVMAAIRMRREHFARQFYKLKSGEALPERRITPEEAQAELADKELMRRIQEEIQLDLDVDRKISVEQRFLDELVAERNAEQIKKEKYEEEQTKLMDTISDVVKEGRAKALALKEEIETLKRERNVIENAKTQALNDLMKMSEKLDELEKRKLLEKACDCQVGQILDELGTSKSHSVSAFTRAKVLEWLRNDVVPLNSVVVQQAVESTVFDTAAMESVCEPSPPDTAPMDSDAPQPGRSLLEDTQVYNRRVLWHQQEVLQQVLEYNADCLHMEHDFVAPCKQWQTIAKDMTALKNDMLQRLQTVKQSLSELDGFLCTDEDVLSGPSKQCDVWFDKIRRFSVKHGDKLAELTKEAGNVFDAIAHHMQKFNEKHSEILVQSGVNRAVEDARAKYTDLQKVLLANVDETKSKKYADTHDERCEVLLLFDRTESIMEDIIVQIQRCKGQRDLPDATQLGLRCDQLADCLGSLRLVLRDLQR